MAIEWNNTIQTIGNLVTVSFSNELGSDKDFINYDSYLLMTI